VRVAGLLLAAGAGRRFGGPKALVSRGGPLWVESAAAALRDGGCAPVVVVLGAGADEVRARAVLPGAVVVENARWATGMGSSLRAGLAALGPAGRAGPAASGVDAAGVDAVVVLPVDTPGIAAGAVRRFVALAAPSALARATYAGAPGHPVLIGRDHWAGVSASAAGDAGARDYLRAHGATPVPCEDVADGADVDRPEDLR